MNQTKTCNDEQLTLYFYGELTSVQRQILDAHLQECPDCRTSLNELQASLAAVPNPELQLSPGRKTQFADQVMERTRRRRVGFPAAWGGALVAGALVLTVVLLRPADQLVPVSPTVTALADFEVLEQLDLLQELDLLKDLDLLQEIEESG